jgi:hypothetical protein
LGRGLSTAAAAATANWVQLPSLHPPRHDHALLPELSPCGGRIESVLAVGGSFGFGKTAKWDAWRLKIGVAGPTGGAGGSWIGPISLGGGAEVAPRAGFGSCRIGDRHTVFTHGYSEVRGSANERVVG